MPTSIVTVEYVIPTLIDTLSIATVFKTEKYPQTILLEEPTVFAVVPVNPGPTYACGDTDEANCAGPTEPTATLDAITDAPRTPAPTLGAAILVTLTPVPGYTPANEVLHSKNIPTRYFIIVRISHTLH
jgi:hypothetical protein